MPVPNSFANVTTSIPLSQLDANFNTPITLGNTAIQLGNTVTTLNNMTLANVTVTSGNVTLTNVSVTTANVTTANIATAQIANVTVSGTGTFAAGSNTAPSITTSGDTNTGIFFPAADTIAFTEGGVESMRIDSSGNVGIGTSSPALPIDVVSNSSSLALSIRGRSSDDIGTLMYYTNNGVTNTAQIQMRPNDNEFRFAAVGARSQTFYTNGSERMRIDSSGNLGLGVTPSAWSGVRAMQIGAAGSHIGALTSSALPDLYIGTNCFYNGSNWIYVASGGYRATRYQQTNGGQHQWFVENNGGTPGNPITFTQAMTLDASGNFLVGQTSGSYNIISKAVSTEAGAVILSVERQQTSVSALLCYGVSQANYNAANAANKMGRDSSTLRSLNAGGTVNASGADYAEYMVKAGDFTIAKGDVCGIDANGKLTNVFADALSFVVKSTDPSYVGGDTWGIDLEGEELEAARQCVDRIAFAGQVPVNVLGASAGQYIVPVNDNGAIKGEAVSNPTFEQYQIAVGKVIAIEEDGRAKIIVKVA